MMKKIKVINKKELDFDPVKVTGVEEVNVFTDRLEIVFLLEE